MTPHPTKHDHDHDPDLDLDLDLDLDERSCRIGADEHDRVASLADMVDRETQRAEHVVLGDCVTMGWSCSAKAAEAAVMRVGPAGIEPTTAAV